MTSVLSLVSKTMKAPNPEPVDNTVVLNYPNSGFDTLFEQFIGEYSKLSENDSCSFLLNIDLFSVRAKVGDEISSVLDFISRSLNNIQEKTRKRVITYMEKDVSMFLNRLGFELTAISHRDCLEQAQVHIQINKYGMKYTASINTHRIVDCIECDCPDFYTNNIYFAF